MRTVLCVTLALVLVLGLIAERPHPSTAEANTASGQTAARGLWSVVAHPPQWTTCSVPARVGADMVVVTCNAYTLTSNFSSGPPPTTAPASPPPPSQQYFSVYSVARGSWSPRTPIPAQDLFAGPNAVGINPAITLRNGDLLFGSDLFRAATDQFVPVGSPGFSNCAESVAVLMRDGRVLLAGGGHFVEHAQVTTCGPPTTQTATYNPATNTWTPAAPIRVAVFDAAATVLPNGDVFVAGGRTAHGSTRDTQIYKPAANRWVLGPRLPAPLSGAAAVTLHDGRVLIVGGVARGLAPQRAAFFFSSASQTITAAPPMLEPQAYFATATTTGGQIMIAGGLTGTLPFHATAHLRDVELFSPNTDTWSEAPPLPRATATIGDLVPGINSLLPLTRGRLYFTTLGARDAIWTPGT